MAWTTPRTWVSTEVVSASIMNTHVRDNFNETAPAVATAAGQLFVADAANEVSARTFSSDSVTTSETTTSTSFTDLTTTGPQVTVTTGTRALLMWSSRMSNNTAGEECRVDFAISGASSRSASNTTSILSTSNAANDGYAFGRSHLATSGLSAGSNTFTLKYLVSGGTGAFDNRFLIVFPL